MTIANCIIDECESTNDLARVLGEAGYPSGTWISARQQLKGRGRHSKDWVSPVGNYYCSWIFRSDSGVTPLSWLPIATGVFIAEVLNKTFPGLDIKIKWPNDLWVGRRKLGGILCEGFHGTGQKFVVIGVGVNCESSPDNTAVPAISLREALPGARVTVEPLRPLIQNAVATLLVQFSQLPALMISRKYEKLALLQPGIFVDWQEAKTSNQKHSGAVSHVGEFGELWVRRNDTAELQRLLSEDVSIHTISEI